MNDMILDSRPPVVRIRNAKREDLPVLAAMVTELAAHHGDSACLSEGALERDLFGPTPWIRALIAESAGHAMGYAILTPVYRANEGARGMEIHQLYVRPTFRSQGIGQSLVSIAREEARRLGCSYMTVGAATGNFRAHRFYETLSFKPRPVTGMRYNQALAG
ncbi:GNAT family N-acetyltransferase [Gellertiella hungarica]|uniref:GNAT superfamily N-acetyltransferase n=1 Tax=Gellertiella hungarica TaxID=1572859 RepID=A0A7W6NJH9_9HYPH|nr:GNAT superfamily N-acetyltransferase [Gellertiella hungarica]